MNICARCQHFTTQPTNDKKEDPDEILRAAMRAEVGIGQCIGFLEMAQIFVEWDDKECGRHQAAKQMAPRDKWILKLQGEKK
jgi:hypothetical protein